jgi:DNA polymerase III delta subunit
MVIFLYGTDRYRLFHNRDMVVNSFRARHGGALNVQTINASVSDAPTQFKAALSNNSFFNNIQLVIVQDIFSNQATALKIGELLNQYDTVNDKQRIVVAVHSGPVSAAKPPEVLKILSDKKNLVREFGPLTTSQFEKWIKNEAVDRGTPFAIGAIRSFMALVGDDSWDAINSLNKLSAYCRGPITAAAVTELVSAEAQPEVFAFIDALGSGNKNHALNLLYRELSLRQDPYYLLTMIIYQFRTMLMVHDASARSKNTAIIAAETGIKPFVIRKMLPVVSRYTIEDLRHIYQSLCDIELGAKQGTRDIKDALYEFVLS